ncbi:MAG: hypothetical protein Q4F74_04810, partial [Synergistaceae bacterium]|nr:hypothetical protein [Synergistaceae bacterium]
MSKSGSPKYGYAIVFIMTALTCLFPLCAGTARATEYTSTIIVNGTSFDLNEGDRVTITSLDNGVVVKDGGYLRSTSADITIRGGNTTTNVNAGIKVSTLVGNLYSSADIINTNIVVSGDGTQNYGAGIYVLDSTGDGTAPSETEARVSGGSITANNSFSQGIIIEKASADISDIAISVSGDSVRAIEVNGPSGVSVDYGSNVTVTNTTINVKGKDTATNLTVAISSSVLRSIFARR